MISLLPLHHQLLAALNCLKYPVLFHPSPATDEAPAAKYAHCDYNKADSGGYDHDN